MIFGSVCSGIESASVAWAQLGWWAAFVSEIEPFPCHALAHHHGASRPEHMPDPAQALTAKDRRPATPPTRIDRQTTVDPLLKTDRRETIAVGQWPRHV